MGIPPLPFIGRAPNLNARGAFFRSLAFCHCLLPFLGVKGAKPLASPGVDKRSLYVHRVGWLSVQRRDEQIWQERDNAEFFISLKKWIYTMGDMIGIFSFVVSCCSHIGARIGTVFARLATAFPSHKNRLPVVYDSGYLGGQGCGEKMELRGECFARAATPSMPVPVEYGGMQPHQCQNKTLRRYLVAKVYL